MSALHPNVHGTADVAPLVLRLPAARAAGRKIVAAIRAAFDRDLPPVAVQYGAALAALGFALFAVVLAVQGFAWAALPVAVLALAIVFGAFLPARLAARWDRA